MIYNSTLNSIPLSATLLNDYEKNMQFLYNIYCIINYIFHDKYKY